MSAPAAPPALALPAPSTPAPATGHVHGASVDVAFQPPTPPPSASLAGSHTFSRRPTSGSASGSTSTAPAATAAPAPPSSALLVPLGEGQEGQEGQPITVYGNKTIRVTIREVRTNRGVYRGAVDGDLFPLGHGEYLYNNGDSFVGNFVPCDSNEHYFGKYIHADNGEVYEGSFKSGHSDGVGKHLFSNGRVLEGLWENDKAHGACKMTFPDGAIVEGNWVHDTPPASGKMRIGSLFYEGGLTVTTDTCKMHGMGKMIESNIEFRGNFSNSLKEGAFTVLSEGNRYDCEYKNGKMINGRVEISDSEYCGLFNDKMQYHGKGKLTIKNNDYQFDGEFRNGKFHGQGTENNSHGSYVGSFESGKRHGKGEKFNENQDLVVAGVWEQGELVCGTEFYSNGTKRYSGSFSGNSHHGQGIEFHENGSIFYTGSFAHGQRHGHGKLMAVDGKTYIGTWCEGKMVGDFEIHHVTKMTFTSNKRKYDSDEGASSPSKRRA